MSSAIVIDIIPSLVGWNPYSTAHKQSILLIRISGYLQEEYIGYQNDLIPKQNELSHQFQQLYCSSSISGIGRYFGSGVGFGLSNSSI